MKKDDLLPIGTVVLLKNATHRLMITGFSPLVLTEKNKVYDYWGCFYPEGQVEADQHMAFNNSDIAKIINVGFSDEEEKEFRAKIKAILGRIQDENGLLKVTQEELSKIIANGGK